MGPREGTGKQKVKALTGSEKGRAGKEGGKKKNKKGPQRKSFWRGGNTARAGFWLRFTEGKKRKLKEGAMKSTGVKNPVQPGKNLHLMGGKE